MMTDVPPELKNGSEIPVFGIRFVTTPILSMTWIAILAESPYATSFVKSSGAFLAILNPRNTSNPNRIMTTAAPKKPSSSAMTEKIKSF